MPPTTPPRGLSDFPDMLLRALRYSLLSVVALLGHLPGHADVSAPAQAPAPAPQHPFFRTSLYPAWSRMTPQQALIDLEAAIREADERLNTLAAVTPERATFDNTFLAYEQAEENLRQLQGYMRHLSNVTASPAIQQAVTAISARTSAHNAKRKNTEQIKQVLMQAAKAPWVQELSPAKQLFIRRIISKFETEGRSLTLAQRQRRAAITMELHHLTSQFTENIRQGAGSWQLVIHTQSELHGMPQHWLQQAARAAAQAGYANAWLITPATAHDVLRLCTVEDTRRRCWPGTVATGTRHASDNEPVLHRILELRHEAATMLGYPNHAEMKAHGRMVKDAKHALSIIDDLLAKSKPAWDAYVAAEMKRFSQAAGKPLSTINPWDVAYYNHILPPEQKGFDYSKLTPYLQAENCIQGMMAIWGKLLGLRFEERSTTCLKPGHKPTGNGIEVWHPSVRFFNVYDTATGVLLGGFYLDLYPRQGKGGPAWCMPLRQGNPATADCPAEPHLAVLLANITPPQAGTPHLLSHYDLHTLHHEFGHLMHHLLPHGELRSQGSLGVEQDFLEVPSQLQENWIWEPEALATFAYHHETGAPLPAELAEQIAADRRKSPLLDHMHLLWMAKLDLELHMFYHEKFKGRALDAACAEILAPWQMPWSVPSPTRMRTLDHNITKGYDAGMYIYKWTEVLSSEAFTRFREEGVMNPATGAAYRRAILDKGGSVPAAEQFRTFLNREPDTDALIQRFLP